MPSRPFALLLLTPIVLCLATPQSLFAQPAACLAAADLVNTPDFEASPRSDESAELLALWYADGLVADGALYERIHADLEQAAFQFPQLDLWPAWRGVEIPDGVLIRFVDVAARDAAEAGDNEAFNCLTDLLDVSSVTFWNSITWAYAEFDGRYDIPLTKSLFELIPEIDLTEANASIAYFDTGCFHSPDGVGRVYFLEEVVVLFPATGTGNVERVELSADGTVSYEEFDHRSDAPWQSELEACLDRKLSGHLDRGLTTVEDIPTLSEIGLLVLVLSLLAAGVVSSRGV